jgi:aminopeptidase N
VIEKFEILQSAPAEYPTLRPHRMAIGCYNLVANRMVRTSRLEIDVAGPITEVRELAGTNMPDLILLNDDDLAYAKIRLDDLSLQTAINHLSKFDDSLARSLVLGAVWDSTRDAETPVVDFISLVLKNISSETESTTVLTLLRQLVTATRTFSAEKNRNKYIEQTADALFNLAEAAEPGSDTQFQFIKFFANFASTESQLDKLEALLSGELTLAKLAVDTDLRWEFITGLVSAGRYGQRQISAALEKDNTSNGQRAAIAAEAAIPTADAKAAMWTKLTTDKSLSNVMVNAGSLGFVRANDPSLLEPFIDKYFEAVLPIWQSNTFKIAEYLLENLYPVELASSALAQRTAEKIAEPEVAAIPALKRILVENLANVERALKTSALDARS